MPTLLTLAILLAALSLWLTASSLRRESRDWNRLVDKIDAARRRLEQDA